LTKKSSFASLQDRANLLYAIYTEIIRKILDTAENVNDAIKIFKKYSLHNIVVPLHYLVSDATGNSVIIEYMNGAVEVQDLNQTSKMLTNFKYYSSQNDIANKTKEYLATGKILKDVSMKKKSMYGDFYTVLLRWNSGFDVSNSISLPDAGVASYLKNQKL
jgi:penicillin V acylase-like amidase (Ntn superfamily)